MNEQRQCEAAELTTGALRVEFVEPFRRLRREPRLYMAVSTRAKCRTARPDWDRAV
jgi:hypothetical protein